MNGKTRSKSIMLVMSFATVLLGACGKGGGVPLCPKHPAPATYDLRAMDGDAGDEKSAVLCQEPR